MKTDCSKCAVVHWVSRTPITESSILQDDCIYVNVLAQIIQISQAQILVYQGQAI